MPNKFASVEEAAKAHASGQFNRVATPPPEEAKPIRRGAIGSKTVEETSAKLRMNLRRSETTLERKRRAPPPPPASISPPTVHEPKIKKLVVALPTGAERLPLLPELSTTPSEIEKTFDPTFDTYQRLKSFDSETLMNAITTQLPLKTQLEIVQAYSNYLKVTTPKNSDTKPASSEYDIPSTIY